MTVLAQVATILAQGAEGASGKVSLWESAILDEWYIPFGNWFDQAVRWIANNLTLLLGIINWPFEFLNRVLVTDFLTQISWIWVVLGMALIAWLSRNLKVAVFVAVALTVCGLLGKDLWVETAATIGYIAVAVILCVGVGIPIGIACGRVDSIWQTTRPVLDAMQVVHSFVYMIPFIWFFGIGEVSATMVTMVFALPPLIRLTNLGIRQVPEDVVEAARAYGASERRVLFDVQIPLARAAIMTGINQTLLLSISMLGIAAIMGAGGLGRPLLRAINNSESDLAASAGLAFFLVAVVIDRMSQREGAESGKFLGQIRLAWKHWRDPEMLIPDTDTSAVVKHEEIEQYAPIATGERLPMLLTLIGGVVAIVSTFLPWTANAGKISAWGRWADASLEGELEGQIFNGLSASGGSWFGITVLLLGIFVVLTVMGFGARPGRGPRWLAADGAVVGAIPILIIAAAHFLARSVSDAGLAIGAVDPGQGVGVYLAMLGGLVASVGAILWIRVAEHEPLHPLPLGIRRGQLIGLGVAILTLLIGMYSGWSYDRRVEAVMTPSIQAKIEELQRRAIEKPEESAVVAAEMLILQAQMREAREIVTYGLDRTFNELVDSDGPEDGPREVVKYKSPLLGLWALIAGLVALLTGLPAVGIFGDDERWKWRWSTVTAGIGAGAAGIAFAWIFTHVRLGWLNFLGGYVTGVGSFLTLVGGVLILASAMAVIKEFRRANVYNDPIGTGE